MVGGGDPFYLKF